MTLIKIVLKYVKIKVTILFSHKYLQYFYNLSLQFNFNYIQNHTGKKRKYLKI